jgi:hypothetical protein
MKGEKQSRLDNVEKRMAAMTNVMQQIISELSMLKDLSVGTLETIKLMSSYEEAIYKLKEKAVAKSSEGEKINSFRENIE